jgi:hypothetical protein
VVKYATVNTAESETRTVIPRFMFVLGARPRGISSKLRDSAV